MRAQTRAAGGGYYWDKSAKKYVRLQPGESVKGGKRSGGGSGRNESGAKVRGCGGGEGVVASVCTGWNECMHAMGAMRPATAECRVGARLPHGSPPPVSVQGAKAAPVGQLYQKWTKKTHLKVSSGGGREEDGTVLAAQMADRWGRGGGCVWGGGGGGDGKAFGRHSISPLGGECGGDTLPPTHLLAPALCRFKKGGRGWVNPLKPADVPNAGAREEMRSADQVRKGRKVEEKKKEHLQRVSARACVRVCGHERSV